MPKPGSMQLRRNITANSVILRRRTIRLILKYLKAFHLIAVDNL